MDQTPPAKIGLSETEAKLLEVVVDLSGCVVTLRNLTLDLTAVTTNLSTQARMAPTHAELKGRLDAVFAALNSIVQTL